MIVYLNNIKILKNFLQKLLKVQIIRIVNIFQYFFFKIVFLQRGLCQADDICSTKLFECKQNLITISISHSQLNMKSCEGLFTVDTTLSDRDGSRLGDSALM